MSLDPVVALVLAGGLALLFGAGGLAKLRDLPGFAAAIAGYRLLPPRLERPAAVGFVTTELALACALLMPGTRPAAALGAAALLALYSLAIGWNLARGRRAIDCGCGGPLGRRAISEALVVRNGLLMAAAAATSLPVLARPLGALDVFTAGAALGGAALLYAATEALYARPVAS